MAAAACNHSLNGSNEFVLFYVVHQSKGGVGATALFFIALISFVIVTVH